MRKTAERRFKRTRGFTLIEIIVSIVAIGILMGLVINVFAPEVVRGTDPLYSMRASELGQSYLEEILGKRFAENSPGGNQIRCGETGGPGACAALGIDNGETAGAPNTFDDVDDYITLNKAPVLDQNGNPRVGYSGFLVTVNVAYAGTEVGLADNTNAKRIQVTITDPHGQMYIFATYKTNF